MNKYEKKVKTAVRLMELKEAINLQFLHTCKRPTQNDLKLIRFKDYGL